jgi:CDP-glycerol glycerophosphotransferase (TagB/SpsB family)
MKKKIIATSWHPGGTNAILPVIKRLNGEGKVDVLTIGHQYSEKIFQNNGVNYRTIGSYGLSDVSAGSMSQLLQEEPPDLVLTGTSDQDKDNRDVIEQTLTLAARKRGIKSLAVLDFWTDYTSRFSDIFTGEKLKFFPDKIAIMDKLAEEAMIREGFDKERLVVTGNPYFDELIELKKRFGKEDRRKVRADLAIAPYTFLILYASQPIEFHYGQELGYTEKTALRELLDSVNSFPRKADMDILVKVHPRENKRDLEEITEKYNLPIVVDQSYPIRQAILASDAVVSPFSTALVESSYLDLPSISLQPGLKKDDLLITNRLGVTVPVYKQGEFGAVLEKLLFDENYAKELYEKRKGFRTDGKATERVTNLVYEMVG